MQVVILPGQYYDAESNLHYNYFRDYDPQTGRYVQSDPIGILQDYSDPQMQVAISMGLVVLGRPLGKLDKKDSTGFLSGLNTYAYVEGNPISYVDPLGLIPPGADPECFRRGECVCATAECAAGLPPIPTYGCPVVCNVKYQFVCTGAGVAGAAVGISPMNAAGLGNTCILTKALICKKLCNECDK